MEEEEKEVCTLCGEAIPEGAVETFDSRYPVSKGRKVRRVKHPFCSKKCRAKWISGAVHRAFASSAGRGRGEQ